MRVVDITIFFFGLVCEEEHPLLPSYFGSTFDVSSLVCFYHIDRSRSRKSILCWSTYFILFLDEFQVRHCHIVWRVLGVSTEAWPKMSCFLAHLRECLAGGDSLCFVTVRLKLCSPEATSWATYGSRDAEFALKSTAQALVL